MRSRLNIVIIDKTTADEAVKIQQKAESAYTNEDTNLLLYLQDCLIEDIWDLDLQIKDVGPALVSDVQ